MSKFHTKLSNNFIHHMNILNVKHPKFERELITKIIHLNKMGVIGALRSRYIIKLRNSRNLFVMRININNMQLRILFSYYIKYNMIILLTIFNKSSVRVVPHIINYKFTESFNRIFLELSWELTSLRILFKTSDYNSYKGYMISKKYVKCLADAGWSPTYQLYGISNNKKLNLCHLENNNEMNFDKKFMNMLLYDNILNDNINLLKSNLTDEFSKQIGILQDLLNNKNYIRYKIISYYILYPILEHLLMQNHLAPSIKSKKSFSKSQINNKINYIQKNVNKKNYKQELIDLNKCVVIANFYGGIQDNKSAFYNNKYSKYNKYNRNTILHGKVNPLLDKMCIIRSLQLLLLCCNVSKGFINIK